MDEQTIPKGKTPRTCEICGTDFFAQTGNVRRGGGKYCSRACYAVSKVRVEHRECPQCGGAFQVKPSVDSAFCSRACSLEQRAIERDLEDDSHRAAVLGMYEDGASMHAVSTRLGIGMHIVKRIVQAAGIERSRSEQMRHHHGTAHVDRESAVAMYEAGASTYEVGQRLGVSSATVSIWLNELGDGARCVQDAMRTLYPSVHLTCDHCHAEFTTKPGLADAGRRFCSDECYHRSRRKVVPCATCESPVEVQQSNSRKRVFCGDECRHRARFYECTCEQCGVEFEVSTRQPDRRFCSTVCTGIASRKGETRLQRQMQIRHRTREPWRTRILEASSGKCVFCERKARDVDHYPVKFVEIFDKHGLGECSNREFAARTREGGKVWKELTDVRNGRALCKRCHRKTGSYGQGTKTAQMSLLDEGV